MNLIATFVMTLVGLAIPFVIYVTATAPTRKRTYKWPVVVYLLLASPVLVSIVSDYIMQYEDANIGLGLAFMFTWLVTGIAFFIVLFVVARKKWF